MMKTTLLLVCSALIAAVATAQTPQLLADLEPGAGDSYPYSFVEVGDRVAFVSWITDGEIWATDGTTNGTVVVASFPNAQYVSHLRQIGDRALFFVRPAGAAVDELWVTDGTSAGTGLVGPVPGIQYPDFEYLPAVSGRALFEAQVAGINEVWSTDGTLAGTASLGVGSSSVVYSCGGQFAYINPWTPSTGRELWRTDGTAAGSAMVVELTPGPVGTLCGLFETIGEHLYFYSSNATGTGAWCTDGTAAGTQLVIPIVPGDPVDGFADDHFFWVDLDPVSGGYKATNVHTLVTTLLAPGIPNRPTDFVPMGDSWLGVGWCGLWAVDGATMPVPLTSCLTNSTVGYPYVVAGSRYAFAGTWNGVVRTDGTLVGTTTIASFEGRNFAHCNGKVYFAGEDPVHGWEPFVVDVGATAYAIGTGIGEPTRVPRLWLDDPVLGTAVDLQVDNAVAGSVMLLMTSFGPGAALQLPQGTWVHGGPFVMPLEVIPMANATWQRTLPVPADPALTGLDVWFQAGFVGAGPEPLELTAAVHAVLGT